MNRFRLLLVLALMPDESFGWFVLWASGKMVQYPNGLGGFQSNSRKSIQELHEAAREYLEKEEK